MKKREYEKIAYNKVRKHHLMQDWTKKLRPKIVENMKKVRRWPELNPIEAQSKELETSGLKKKRERNK